MINTSEAARRAQVRMDQCFLILKSIHENMEAIRATGELVDPMVYAEWDAAYLQFRHATEEWRHLAQPMRPRGNPPSTAPIPPLD
jgi:hypothetical protein